MHRTGRYDDGLQKQATGLLTVRDDEVLERSLEKPVRNSLALFLGKGRRFKSGRPHHNFCTIKTQNEKQTDCSPELKENAELTTWNTFIFISL